jgi:hypothetical protein
MDMARDKSISVTKSQATLTTQYISRTKEIRITTDRQMTIKPKELARRMGTLRTRLPMMRMERVPMQVMEELRGL